MHRFLSPTAAEAFAGTTPEQVRADLAHIDEDWWADGMPGWVKALHDRWPTESAATLAQTFGFRYLADRAADIDAITPEQWEAGRKAVEDVLIELRDLRVSVLGRHNGLVVWELDGRESSVIRMAIEEALRIGLKAIAGQTVNR